MRLLKLSVIFILISSLFLFTAGCGNKIKKETLPKEANNVIKDQKSKIKLGLSLPSQQEDRWIMDFKAIKDECDRLGIELIYDYADMNSDKQTAQCLSMLSKGIELLILIPYDAEKASRIVEDAHKKNVKVISYDRLIMGADVDVYVSFDNEKVGEILGKSITEAVPSGNYVFLSGAPNDRNCYYVVNGIMKYIKPLVDQGKIKIVMRESVIDWNPDNAFNLMKRAISENAGNIQAVIAPNDGTSGACIKALSDKGLAGKIPVTGQDAEITGVRRIVDGTQLMTVFKDTRLLGKKSVEIAVKMVKGETLDVTANLNNDKKDVPSILLAPVEVTKNNLDEVLIQSGYFTKDSVYLFCKETF